MNTPPGIAQRALRREVLIALALLSGGALAANPGQSAFLPTPLQACALPRPLERGATPRLFPVLFEPNVGQAASNIQFLAESEGRQLGLTRSGPLIRIDKAPATAVASIQLSLLDARPAQSPEPQCPVDTKSHYYLGNDRSRWFENVPNFGQVLYRDVYAGVDLLYYGKDGNVEYDFVAHPGADASAIRFAIEGARQARVDTAGNLVISTDAGEIVHQKPYAYQVIGDRAQQVEASFNLRHDTESDEYQVSFDLGAYDRSQSLVIDPVLAYSGYVGTSGDYAYGSGAHVAVDGAGQVYYAAYDGSSLKVRKLDPATNQFGYTTSLGSSKLSSAITVDAAGKVHVVGRTGQFDDFTCVGATDCAPHKGGDDAFIARLTPTGNVDYLRLLGGSGNDIPNALEVDSSGDIYIAGTTLSADFPSVNPVQSYLGGSGDAFVARITPVATGGVNFSTYLGSSGHDEAHGIAVDPSGRIYVAGITRASSFATVNPIQQFGGGKSDAFVVRINPATPAIDFSTTLGGSGEEFAGSLARDPASGAIYVAGSTTGNFPVTGDAYATYMGAYRTAYLARLDGASHALTYATYIGADLSWDGFVGVKVDAEGAAVAAGTSNFMQTRNQIASALPEGSTGYNSFVIRVKSDHTVDYATYIGGSGEDVGRSIAIGPDRSVWIGGTTTSSDLPKVNSQHQSLLASRSFYLAKLASKATARFDVTGDGRSDVFWHNQATGMLYLLQANGLSLGPGAVVDQETDANWQVAGLGDLNGDGTTDVVWRNSATGAVYGLLQNGPATTSEGTLHVEPNTQWKIEQVADLDGDGKADLVWKHHATGDVYFMKMNGLSVSSGQVVYAEPNLDWKIVASGDLNGDGKADLLWRNAVTGDVFAMIMNGTAVVGGGVIYNEPNLNWKIVGLADFNGDGRADVLWQNTATGDVFEMQMNGTSVAAGQVIYNEPNTQWQIAALGDYDGDGRADLLWRNSVTGQVFMMLMNGFTMTSAGFVYTEPDPNWKIIAK